MIYPVAFAAELHPSVTLVRGVDRCGQPGRPCRQTRWNGNAGGGTFGARIARAVHRRHFKTPKFARSGVGSARNVVCYSRVDRAENAERPVAVRL